ncbi:MAG TPA: Hpt domain-containing protein [Bdellovibrio sp.]|uniref:Hpt domain-containing protein n=1 Tax=Bdellovibrio sp. TaxID=28201 RepID=UPI002EEDFA1F
MASGLSVPKESQIRYLSRRQEEIAKVLAELEQGDFELAKKVGHQMKGNASTFNFPELESLGKKLDAAALDKDLEAARSSVNEISAMVEKLLKALV